MTDKYNEYLPIEKFLGMNIDYENPDNILEILNKPLDTSTFRQPDFEEFLNLPVNPDYEKQREENEAILRERTEYVKTEEHKQKVYEENVKVYDDLIKSLDSVVEEINDDNNT
jgi:hypothetical protein